jgi:hypothetical protein
MSQPGQGRVPFEPRRRCEVIRTHPDDDTNGQAEQLAQELLRTRRGVHGRAHLMKKDSITMRSGIRFRMGPVWVAPLQKSQPTAGGHERS